jgi:PKD repeat protein
MRNRAYLIVALLGLLTFALAPGYAAASVQGQNLTEIALASDAAARASAVSATIDVAPLSAALGIVNVGGSASTMFVITNTGDSDLHISGVTSNNSSFSVVSVPATVSAGGGTGNLSVSYNPTTGTNESGTITINSDASNGATFGVNVSGSGNVGPTLAPIGNKAAPAFVTLSFSAVGTDNGDQVDDDLSYSVAPALPPGATFNAGSGAFSWEPTASDAGVHTLTFCVSDTRLDDCETIDITVTADNHPPVADAAGPYQAGPGMNIQFNGSASSDPDGDALTFAWDFGDGNTAGNNATPTHAYAAAGSYLVSLTVTDDGSPNLSSTDLTSAEIIASIPVTVAVKLAGSGIKIGGGGTQVIGVETNTRPVTDVNPTSIKLSTTYPDAGSVSQISVLSKGGSVGDIDRDNLPDMDVFFSRSDLGLLLGNVPNNTIVTLVVTGFTTTAGGTLPLSGTAQVKIKSGGAAAVSAFASPNPFNPATSVAYTLKKGGVVSVRIYPSTAVW